MDFDRHRFLLVHDVILGAAFEKDLLPQGEGPLHTLAIPLRQLVLHRRIRLDLRFGPTILSGCPVRLELHNALVDFEHENFR